MISLECTMEVAAERIKAMPESAVIADHNDEEGFHRRLPNTVHNNYWFK